MTENIENIGFFPLSLSLLLAAQTVNQSPSTSLYTGTLKQFYGHKQLFAFTLLPVFKQGPEVIDQSGTFKTL